MVVIKQDVPFGHAPHPQTPFSILTNLPGWQMTKDFREGDRSAFARLKHIYPRFCPWGHAGQLAAELAKRTGHEGMMALPFLTSDAWSYALRHSTSPAREEEKVTPDAMALECVFIDGERLFVVLHRPEHTGAFIHAWQFSGLGISQRHAEKLLQRIEGLEKVNSGDYGLENVPEPTFTKEGEAHEGLRNRICDLLHRAPLDARKETCAPKDVYLYPTGMAAIWYMANWLSEINPGAAVVLGIPFHNTYHHLVEEAKGGLVNFPGVDEEGLDKFEKWLDGEADAGRKVSWVYAEFPGNPTLETPDIERLKKLSEKHSFVFIIDDTLSGFGNVNVLPMCDMLVTSLTKSFNGNADAMGGSIVLNPSSPHYTTVSAHWSSNFRNELFVGEAEVLLENSRAFLERTAALNRNAAAMAEYLQKAWVGKEGSPVVAVRYPPLTSTHANYARYLRPGVPSLPAPGYGCIITVDFASEELAAAFYDRVGFLPTPHLAAPVTLMLAYNMLVFGKKPEEREYVRRYGIKEEAVRISAGWRESAEDLVDTLEDALKAIKKDMLNGNGVEPVTNGAETVTNGAS